MMMIRAAQAVRRRPWTSFVVTTTVGGTVYAHYLEKAAEESSLSSSSSSSSSTKNIATLPRAYDWQALTDYWGNRPISTIQRLGQISYHLVPCAAAMVWDFVIWRKQQHKSVVDADAAPKTSNSSNRDSDSDDAVMDEPEEAASVALQRQHASRLREALTQLGPCFVKAGQQLSIRPDLVPPVMLKELQKLCDEVQPVDDAIALQVIRDELGLDNLDETFENLQLVASASLGQVYKAKLRSTGAEVAVKVQRPDMRRAFSLDLFLLQHVGVVVDKLTQIFTNQPPFHKALYESFAAGSYSELDYEQEAANQKRFQKELLQRNCPVVIPNVYDQHTTEKVITSQWIDGVKLADSSKERIRELIPVGVELFLTQLLDIGAFHADPHPGNLLVTSDGKLCLLDFGLCAEVDTKSRNALTKAIVHLLLRDFDALVSQDAIELGFLPADFDASALKPLLTKILTVGVVEPGSNLHKRKKKLMEISNELNQVFFQFPFSVPPYFALVTRGLGLLEGIALTGDPDFDIFQASKGFATQRAVAMLGSHSVRHWTRHWTFGRRRYQTKAGM